MTTRLNHTRTPFLSPLWRATLALLLLTPGQATLAQPPAPSVTVAHPELREVVDWDEYTGRFEAVEHVDIRARVAGYLESVHFRDGQLIKKGDLLFTIDPRPFEAAVARAEANLDRAKTQLALAGLELSRAERLVKKSMMSHEETDTRRTNRAATAAEVAAAEAELRTARLELGYARITAPISGRVSRRQIDVGNLIKVNDPLTSIVTLDPMYFVFDASEAEYLEFVRQHGADGTPGTGSRPATVNLRLMDEDGWKHTGHLDFLDNQLDTETGTIRMRAVFKNTGGILLPGVFGRLRLAATAPYQALLIPDQAVLSDQSAKLVMTVAADGTVVPRPVQLGGLHEGQREVLSGVTASDRVIVKGLLRARPGTKVSIEELSAKKEVALTGSAQ